MEFYQYKNQSIYYSDNHKDAPCIVLLHGWGQSSELMKPIQQHYEHDFRVLNIDCAGFGLSDPLQDVWGISDYADSVIVLLKKLNVSNPIIIAHSFGARIAIVVANKIQVSKMILTGAAGIKPKKSLATKMRILFYKSAKQVLKLPGLSQFQPRLQSAFGSEDYKNTSGFLRQSFVRIVNEDLTAQLSFILAPTLLIWGEHDDATPLWMGQLMEKLIPDAGLVVFEEDDHYAYLHQLKRFLTVTDVFLQQKESRANE